MHWPLTNGTRKGGTLGCATGTVRLSVTSLVTPGTRKMPKNCDKNDTSLNVTMNSFSSMNPSLKAKYDKFNEI